MEFLFQSLGYIFGWNMQIKCISAILLVIVWVSYMKNRRLPLKRRKYFITLLILATISWGMDLISTYTAYHSDVISEGTNAMIHRLYYTSFCMAMCSVYYYMLSTYNKVQDFFSSVSLVRCIPLIVFVIAIFHSDYAFYLGEDGAYLYGQMIRTTYIGMFIYCFMALSVVLRNCRKWNRALITSSVVSFAVWIVSALLQIRFKTVDLTNVGFIIMIMVNYLVFEDPREYFNVESGYFNETAYRVMVDENFKSENPFRVFQISFKEFSFVHRKYGHDVCQQILRDLSNIVVSCTGRRVYALEEEYRAFILNTDDGIIESMIDSILDKIEYNWNYNNNNTIHVSGVLYEVDCPKEAASMPELEDLFGFMKTLPFTDSTLICADADLLGQKKRYADIVQLLEYAIYNDGFEMVYQPIYSTKDNCFHSAEALIRLKDKETLGFVSPEEFITIAEKESLIMQIGEIVLNKVCSFAKENNLIERGIQYIEVNLSGIQCIDQGLPKQIEDVVEKYGLPFNFLNLEITETAAVESGEMLTLNMDKLTDKGVVFSMDDFGTGYSNLAQMADTAYDLIKIDKSLVWYCYPQQRSILKKDELDPVSGVEKSKVVLAKVIKLIEELNLKVVAEGVETKEMVDMLTENGVDYLQGYYYSRPLAEQAYLEFLNVNA